MSSDVDDTVLPSDPLESDGTPLVWQCRACKRWRLDRFISVWQGSALLQGGGTVGVNITYCNDREVCKLEGQKLLRHDLNQIAEADYINSNRHLATPDEATTARYAEALAQLTEDNVTLECAFSPVTLATLIAGIQLALRHPGVSEAVADRLRRACDMFIDMLAEHRPELAPIMRLGYDASQDVATDSAQRSASWH